VAHAGVAVGTGGLHERGAVGRADLEVCGVAAQAHTRAADELGAGIAARVEVENRGVGGRRVGHGVAWGVGVAIDDRPLGAGEEQQGEGEEFQHGVHRDASGG